jgi:hypothetical protein
MQMEKSGYVTWKKLEGGKSVLLDLKSGRYYTMNETATVVWELAAAHVPTDEIVRRVGLTFESGFANRASDVRELVNALTEKGFLCKAAIGDAEAPVATGTLQPYVKPTLEEHEAVQEITAAGTGGSRGPDGHYWYPN